MLLLRIKKKKLYSVHGEIKRRQRSRFSVSQLCSHTVAPPGAWQYQLYSTLKCPEIENITVTCFSFPTRGTRVWRLDRCMSKWITFLESCCLCWTRGSRWVYWRLFFLLQCSPEISLRGHYKPHTHTHPSLHELPASTHLNLRSTKHTRAIHPHIVLRATWHARTCMQIDKHTRKHTCNHKCKYFSIHWQQQRSTLKRHDIRGLYITHKIVLYVVTVTRVVRPCLYLRIWAIYSWDNTSTYPTCYLGAL